MSDLIAIGTRVRSVELNWNTSGTEDGTAPTGTIVFHNPDAARSPWPYGIQWDHNPPPQFDEGWLHAEGEFEVIEDEA